MAEHHVFADGDPAATRSIVWSYYVAVRGSDVTLIDVGFRDPEVARTWGVELLDVTAEVRDLLAGRVVRHIFVTHEHFDHTDNLDEVLAAYPGACVTLSEAAHRHLTAEGAAATRAALAAARVREVSGSASFDEWRVETVAGHTAGSSVVVVTHGARRYVLTGDECYLRESVTSGRAVGVHVSMDRNVHFLRRLAAEGDTVLPCHDPMVFEEYEAVSTNVVRVF
ncbi:MBL fold metallo-hydrolase [Microbacterium sp. TNHR37B]|uniref:MBL fold metallo-hydrolase n=1 Tax=Microbacterium sp. TNHR37B TaxID=1775956 RepID=UPI0007B21299|nr:MBL fold metallo-hydrolase [Microbacterium sp. TNHR37B]KZE90768.1 Hydroxyacylglutathione hydrolase [Microbacterium sp. TNHR37B]